MVRQSQSADAEGVTPQDIVDKYHNEFLSQWESLGISWDLYTTTGTDHHAKVTQEMFLAQLNNGHIDRRTTTQLYDPKAKRFLPDRYVEEFALTAGMKKHEETNAMIAGKPMTQLNLKPTIKTFRCYSGTPRNRTFLFQIFRLQ